MSTIRDATTQDGAHVDANHDLHTFSVIEDLQRQATDAGDEYNINTGVIALTGTAESAMLYFKNDEDNDYVIAAIAVGLGTRSATIDDVAHITIVRNPTGGTIVDDAEGVTMKSNTNFGSSKTLKTSTLLYKASASGKTLTGGQDHALLFMSGTRLYASLNMELGRGNSIGVKIDLNTSGGADVYCALIGYVSDINNK